MPRLDFLQELRPFPRPTRSDLLVRDSRARIIQCRLNLVSEPLVVGRRLVRLLQGLGSIRPHAPGTARVVMHGIHVEARYADAFEIGHDGIELGKEPRFATLRGERPFDPAVLYHDPPAAGPPGHMRATHGASLDQLGKSRMVYGLRGHKISCGGDEKTAANSLIILLLSDKRAMA